MSKKHIQDVDKVLGISIHYDVMVTFVLRKRISRRLEKYYS
jgi:hypothetical protein